MQLKRDGGLAFLPSLKKTWVLDTDTLSAEDAAEVNRLLNEVHFFELPLVMPPDPPGAADQYHYTLTIEQAARSHAVHFSELTSAPSLQELRRYLQIKGAPQA